MRILLVAALMLVPIVVNAGTNCHVTENSDNFVAECVGDEKAVPVPELPSSLSQHLPQPVVRDQSQTPASVPAAPSPRATAQPGMQPLPTQGGMAHRQGRQQYQKGLEDARAVRDLLIKQQQGQ